MLRASLWVIWALVLWIFCPCCASLEEEFNIHLPERVIRKVVTVGDMVDSICEIIRV